jgi:hypothetical protein
VPLVPGSGTAAQPIGIGLPEFPAPIPHGFIGQDDATGRHELFDIPIAEAEAKVQPHAMADDLRRESMALVGIGCWWGIHVASMPHEGRAEKGEGNLTPIRQFYSLAAYSPAC